MAPPQGDRPAEAVNPFENYEESFTVGNSAGGAPYAGSGPAEPAGAASRPRGQAGYISGPEQFDDVAPARASDGRRTPKFRLESVNFDDEYGAEREDGFDARDEQDGDGDHSRIQRQGSTVRRHRWGTQRHPEGRPQRKKSTLQRLTSLRHPNGKNDSAAAGGRRRFSTRIGDGAAAGEDEAAAEEAARSRPPRKLYFNMPLPSDRFNADGTPVETYGRNKIRTTKYTPLNFLPKNIYFQFRNVANVYFLFIVILGAFSIFGVQSPGMAAVPIVVIVVITAIKDAIEDYRRTLLDLEVNNTLTELLVNNPNPNQVDEKVSMWRRFKKANTRLIMRIGRWVHGKRAARRERKTGVKDTSKSIFNAAAGQKIGGDVASIYSQDSITLQDMPSSGSGSGSGGTASNPFGPDGNDDDEAETFVNPRAHPGTRANFRVDYWKNVRAGDFVRVRSDQEIPADMVILSTSEEDGACYIETKNLDGETNLKVRQALRAGRRIRHSADAQKAEFWVECEPPMANLYTFSGVARWRPNDMTLSEPIGINNLLLRGCTLRNTGWVIGVVVYTGMDTKIMMNAGITPTKRSRLQRELNRYVFWNFAITFILCLCSGLVNGIMHNSKRTSAKYFERGIIGGSPPVAGIVTFFAAVILYQSLVPISLYISIEIVKTIQAFFIYSDVYMYYEKIDYPPTPKSWNISDDLGQIEYIFSDKTGTLTQNVMEFKKCTINGVAYGRAYTEALAGLRKRQGIDVEAEEKSERVAIAADKANMVAMLQDISHNSQLVPEEVTFVSTDYVKDLQGASGPIQAAANRHFMLALALCNSVITEASKTVPGRRDFKAQSPDEAALVAAARDVGFTLVGRVRRGVIVNVQGTDIEFQILNTLEFNSTRKRMSAIVRLQDPETKEDRILLLCKGADSVIYDRLKPGIQKELREKTAVQLESFANEGLRTLCLAERELTLKEYNEWNARHEKAAAEIYEREEKLEEVADSIERNLILLGGTAIEDRLQDGVPRTISLLGDGGVKLWVLTGDKVETAINIGFSCNLLDNSMELLIIRVENGDKSSVPAMIDEMLMKNFNMEGSLDELEEAKNDHSTPDPRFAVVIDGEALRLALNPAIQHKFLLLCKQCKSVLCCRVSPAQKAAVVRMVRRTLDVMTLSIGDGANDVAMIQEADVGVGIAGEEGRQAVMSSDYAIGQFRFLARLMLVHGRWSYKRLSEMIPNFFYKNVVFTFTLFWYNIFQNFDGSYLYDYTFVMFFNLAFTSLPVIIMGILDQDVPDKISLAVPQLYRRGILRAEFTERKFWLYMFEGMFQSFVAFFFPYFAYQPGRFESSTGRQLDHRFWMGLISCCIAVCCCNFYVLTNQYRWDWFSTLINVISSLLVFFWSGVYSSSTFSSELYQQGSEMLGSLVFWATFLLGIVTGLIPHFVVLTLRALWRPMDVDIIREQWKLGEFDRVMATPLASDDPDAARYENPYRSDAAPVGKAPLTPRTPRRTSLRPAGGASAPYQLQNDSHASLARSPDYIRVGGQRVETEQFDWDAPNAPRARDQARAHASPDLRQSLDDARRRSRYEQQPPEHGLDEIRTSADFEEGLTTAEGLMHRTGFI